eukprot:4441388-Amphidinium_carterae.2
MKVKEEYLTNYACRCTNGFSISERLAEFSVAESGLRITGVIRVLTSLREFLSSEAALRLTRLTISHFECMMHAGAITEYGLLTPESLLGLSVPTLPGANKIVATNIVDTVSRGVSQLEWEDEKAAAAATAASSSDEMGCMVMQITIQPGDEITVKKMKRTV